MPEQEKGIFIPGEYGEKALVAILADFAKKETELASILIDSIEHDIPDAMEMFAISERGELDRVLQSGGFPFEGHPDYSSLKENYDAAIQARSLASSPGIARFVTIKTDEAEQVIRDFEARRALHEKSSEVAGLLKRGGTPSITFLTVASDQQDPFLFSVYLPLKRGEEAPETERYVHSLVVQSLAEAEQSLGNHLDPQQAKGEHGLIVYKTAIPKTPEQTIAAVSGKFRDAVQEKQKANPLYSLGITFQTYQIFRGFSAGPAEVQTPAAEMIKMDPEPPSDSGTMEEESANSSYLPPEEPESLSADTASEERVQRAPIPSLPAEEPNPLYTAWREQLRRSGIGYSSRMTLPQFLKEESGDVKAHAASVVLLLTIGEKATVGRYPAVSEVLDDAPKKLSVLGVDDEISRGISREYLKGQLTHLRKDAKVIRNPYGDTKLGIDKYHWLEPGKR